MALRRFKTLENAAKAWGRRVGVKGNKGGWLFGSKGIKICQGWSVYGSRLVRSGVIQKELDGRYTLNAGAMYVTVKPPAQTTKPIVETPPATEPGPLLDAFVKRMIKSFTIFFPGLRLEWIPVRVPSLIGYEAVTAYIYLAEDNSRQAVLSPTPSYLALGAFKVLIRNQAAQVTFSGCLESGWSSRIREVLLANLQPLRDALPIPDPVRS